MENQIYLESCLDTLSRLKDNSIDVVITSPPYNMNLRIRGGKYCSRQIVKEFSSKYESFDDNLPIEDFYQLHTKILSELIRVSKIVFYNYSIVTGSKRAFIRIINDHVDYYKDEIIWDKGHGQPAMQSGVLNRRTEKIVVFDKENGISRKFDTNNFDRGTLDDIWEIGRERSLHPDNKAVFPQELVKKILLNFSNEGDIVYDPFSGTGNTCVVAKELGRRYLGSEISSVLFKFSTDRLKGI
jgi:site-specific DNA-methyltransferase (adenine-specific)